MKTILDSNPFISIIIPIYNSSKYLRRCLDSILNQTYTNFECILVNDGSTDNSGEVCNEYSLKDNRFKSFHKKNEGVSSTRNYGLDRAKGEWIIIIDSDDYVENDYVKGFLNAPFESELVIQSISDYSKGDVNCNIEYHFENRLYKKYEIGSFFSNINIYKYGTPWSRMYNAEIIKRYNLKYIESYSIKEDVLFSITYLMYCNSIYTTSYMGYHYIYYPNSLVRTNKMNYETLLNVSYDIYKNSIKNTFLISDKKCLNVIKRVAIDAFFSSLRKAYVGNIPYDKRIEHIKEIKYIIKQEKLTNYINKKNLFLLLPAKLIDIINLLY